MCDSGGQSGGTRLRPLPRPSQRFSAPGVEEASERQVDRAGHPGRTVTYHSAACLVCYLCQPKKEAISINPMTVEETEIQRRWGCLPR